MTLEKITMPIRKQGEFESKIYLRNGETGEYLGEGTYINDDNGERVEFNVDIDDKIRPLVVVDEQPTINLNPKNKKELKRSLDILNNMRPLLPTK